MGGFWWDQMLPLAADHEIAAEKYHWTVTRYYAETTWKERLFNRIAFAYRSEQEQEVQDQAERRREREAAIRQQMQRYGQDRY